MTPEEKLDWFWAVGVLRDTLFDGLSDQKPEMPRQHHRREAKRRQLGSRKRPEEALERQ